MSRTNCDYNIGDLVEIYERVVDMAGIRDNRVYVVVLSRKRELIKKVDGSICLYDCWELGDPHITYTDMDIGMDTLYRKYRKIQH